MSDTKQVMKKKIKLWIFILIIIIILSWICSLFIESSSAQEVDTSIDCYENIIALTFDDGPRRSTTEKLLDGLKERGVKATFFLLGEKIEGNEDLVKRMHDEGHLIGNHTYSHVRLTAVSNVSALGEVKKTNEIIESIIGEEPEYIRPPFGAYTDKIQLEIDMTKVMWTIDPLDWKTTDVNAVVESVVQKAKCGDIILLHDIYDSSVVEALEIIDRLQDKGFVFVTVDQIILD